MLKEDGPVGDSLLMSEGSLAPFPSAITRQLCSRSPAENQVTRREEAGFFSLASLRAPGSHREV